MLKLFVSDYTYRTEAAQLKKLYEDPRLINAPIFRPADLSAMFRATQRDERDTYCAASLACFGKTPDGLVEFLDACRKRKACIVGVEEKFEWNPGQSNAGAVKAWKLARVKGSALAGAEISANNRKAKSKLACDTIRAEWCQPNKKFPTAMLLKKAAKFIGKRKKLHYRTAIRFFGRRPIEQANYEAAKKRKEVRNARN